jgi:hypothetical protein
MNKATNFRESSLPLVKHQSSETESRDGVASKIRKVDKEKGIAKATHLGLGYAFRRFKKFKKGSYYNE